MHYLALPELHDTYREGRLSLVGDDVLGDPEITAAQHASDVKPRWFGWVMTTKLLDVPTSADALARLRIVAYGVVVINVMFCFLISGCRCFPVSINHLPNILIIHCFLLSYTQPLRATHKRIAGFIKPKQPLLLPRQADTHAFSDGTGLPYGPAEPEEPVGAQV